MDSPFEAAPATIARRVWAFGACSFDETRWELRIDGERRALEAKPLALLQTLLAKAGEVVTKDELLEAVWPGVTVVEASITTAIGKLRSALGDDDRRIIEAVPRIGYRIGVPVMCTEKVAAAEPALPLAAGSAVPMRPQWRLEAALGEAAARSVWLARHEKTGERRVFKFAVTAGQLSALKRETTLSRLLQATLGTRPDFVPIAEWNFDAPPFFTESAYGGENLTEWAKAQGGIGLVSLEIRLKLAVSCCRSVAAAHSVGVLHKDIKPANILVCDTSDGPLVRLVDFGSGQLMDRGLLNSLQITGLGLTQTHSVMADSVSGTLLYMAPELLRGEMPTVAADIFALGIVLYQLVVGDLRRPLAAGWELEVADALLRQDIADAAAGDRTRRIGSAGTLADRLEALEARRAEAAAEEAQRRLNEELRRDAERRRLEAEAAAERAAHAVERVRRTRRAALAVSVLFVAASALAVYAQYQRSVAAAQRDRAERITGVAEAAVSGMVDDLAHGMQDQSGVTLAVLQKLLEQARVTVTRMTTLAPGDGQLRRLEARMLAEFASTYLHAGDLAQALSTAERAAGLQQALLETDPDNRPLLADFCRSQYWIGNAKLAQRDLPGAMAAYQTGASVAARLARADPSSSDYLQRLARMREGIGDVQLARGDNPAALATYRGVLKIIETAMASSVKADAWQLDLSTAKEKIGDALDALGDYAGALASYRADLAIRQRLLQLDPGNMRVLRDVAVANSDIGDEQKAMGDKNGSLASYQAERDVNQRLVAADPQNAQWQRSLAISSANVGDAEMRLGNSKAAVPLYESAASILDALARKDTDNASLALDLIEVEITLGKTLLMGGDRPAAYPHAQRALGTVRRLAGSHGKDARVFQDQAAAEDLLRQVGTPP